MKSMSRLTIGFALFILSATAHAATWNVDPAHSVISFSVTHMMMATVRGDFTSFSGSVEFDESNPVTFSVQAEADAASIDTRSEKRDAHLKSADFFDVENHPKLTLVSRKVEKIGDGRYKMTADLTMRGVTKEVLFDVTGFSGSLKSPWGGTVTSAVATATIKRQEWGLVWNKSLEPSGVLVSEDVTVTLDIELVKQEQN